MAQTTTQDLLRRAVILAGAEEVAIAMRVPVSLVEAWMNGHATIPERKLLMLADFLDGLASRG